MDHIQSLIRRGASIRRRHRVRVSNLTLVGRLFASVALRIVIAAAAPALICTSAHAATEPPGFVPFAPNSVWNLPLRNDAAIGPNSSAYVSYLKQSVDAEGAWINSSSCGMPEYWANPNTPTVSVTLDHSSYEDPALIQAWSAVPMPADAAPANCRNQNFAVLQTQASGNIKEWEFWKASRAADGQWSAEWGGAISNVLTDPGVASPLQWTDPSAANPAARQSTDDWNVTASGLSMIAGVITDSDLSSGSINHALAMAVTATAANEWMWPAQRTDGSLTNTDAIPEGAHRRLNASLDINALHLPPLVKMLALAAKKYGIIVRDQTASSDVFYAEPPAAGQPNPITHLLDGESLSRALAAFPWSDLEVLAAPLCTGSTPCLPAQQAGAKVSTDRSS